MHGIGIGGFYRFLSKCLSIVQGTLVVWCKQAVRIQKGKDIISFICSYHHD